MRTTTSNLVSLATEAFANHRLVRCDEDRWLIARASRGRITETAYATEIVSLWHGRLYVGGDIDDCVFAQYVDSDRHIDKLRWIGWCDDLDWYVCQKAQIGMSDSGKLTKEGRGRNRGPSARVVYAWAAVRKLCDLLDEIEALRQCDDPAVVRAGIDEMCNCLERAFMMDHLRCLEGRYK
jgi:hypothetical protein